MKFLWLRTGASAQQQLEPEATSAVAHEDELPIGKAQDYWCRKFGDPELDEIVEEHRAWVESGGKTGKKAELSGANFEAADLMGAGLRGANLVRANLRGADLLVADLRGACLIEADFSEANVVSTNFRGATLAGANLATATGLVARQLGGASLIGASLPETLFPFEGITESAKICGVLRILSVAMLIMCGGICAVIAATTDAALVKNAAAPVPLVGRLIPLLAFYLAAPMLLAGAYIAFHVYLQKLWDVVEELPAVFPDGRRLGECVPSAMLALAPRGICYGDTPAKQIASLRRIVWQAIGYWTVPATLLLVWARYLAEQDWRGSLLQIFFILAAAAMSGFLPRNESNVLAVEEARQTNGKEFWGSWHTGGLTTATAAACLLLVIFTLGVIVGAPRESSRAPELKASDFRRWPSIVFGAVGYDPFPNFIGARLSDAPTSWSSEASDLQAVKGARLQNASLRYAKANRVFLAKAELQGADLSGGEFSEADFRGASLTSARLNGASLFRADFRGADLRYSNLGNAFAAEAKLDGANFYGARLAGARMERASLSKSDLRGAIAENAEMNQVDFSAAYLENVNLTDARLAGAKFNGAFMDGAKLQNADLHGGAFAGAILSAAELNGANLDGADLRGALGLTAGQICSSASRKGAEMDELLLDQVNADCGGNQ